LYASQDIITVIKSKKMRRAGQAACTERQEVHTTF